MKTIEERFWEKVQKTATCWLWGVDGRHGGYGTLHVGGHTDRYSRRAHRVSWEIHHGPIPDGLWVLHKCDNPPCVNPAHLFLGDRRDNMRDAARKGRVCNVGSSRRTHCKRGHDFAAHSYGDGRGHRRCRACQHDYDAARRAPLAAAIRARSEK